LAADFPVNTSADGLWTLRFAMLMKIQTVRPAQMPLVALGLGIGLFLLAAMTSARADQTVTGHIPAAARRATPLGRLAATNRLDLALGLPLQHAAELNQLLADLYNPASPRYHHYLTTAEFAEQFGPSQQDYESVIAFAQTNGLTVTSRHPNRLVLDVSGRVADIERALHIKLQTYQHDREPRTYYAPDREPTLGLTTPLLHIGGLDNYSPPRPHLVASAANVPRSGSGLGGTYLGGDFRAAYVPGVAETGAGQSVALLEFAGYVASDITAYESLASEPAVPLVNVPVNGGVSIPGTGNTEVALDIEMVIDMAPGISNVIVYEAPNGTSWPTILSKIASDNLARQISCSWGATSPGSPDPSSEAIFIEMAVQGQSFFNAVGDADAFSGGIPFPSESTNIVQVGGTVLSTSGGGGSWTGETTWNRGSNVGTGGGISQNYALPAWQQGIDMTTTQGSTVARNVPDVAMIAESVQIVADTNKTENVGGTSCAAPLWAGMTALINQRTAAHGLAPVGFLNPALYNLGRSPGYTNYFHDITTGNNFDSSSPALFKAVPGYDLCTGWGTPNGPNLITVLADALGVLPVTGFTTSGLVGGPFMPTNSVFTVTNTGTGALNWTVTGLPTWLKVTPTSGTLAAGTGHAITTTLAPAANLLPAGIYTGSLGFNDTTSGAGQSRLVTLLVGQSIVLNGGFETGDFTDWTFAGNGTIGPNVYNGVEPASTTPEVVHSGNYGVLLGDTSPAVLSQNLVTKPGQSYLLSFWLDNPVSGSPQMFLTDWNTNSGVNQVYYLTNPPVLAWTNLTFILTATSTENPPQYFGLDDISVTPIPAPSFVAAIGVTNAISLTWYAVPGVKYQVQYTTNLAGTNWVNMSTNAATSSTLSLTNHPGSDRQRFYRILRLP